MAIREIICEIFNLGRWSMSSVWRCLEFEGVARELQGRRFIYVEPQQPGEGVWFYLYVFASWYLDAQRATCIPKGVALQEHALAVRHLEMHVGCAKILKGLRFGDHAVNSQNVHASQGRAPAERACLYSQFSAARDLEFPCIRRNDSFQQLHILEWKRNER